MSRFGYQLLGFGSGGGVSLTAYKVATGGSVSTSGDYKIHTFTSSGTFTVTNPGVNNTVEYLMIGGGGSGGSRGYPGCGGGGGGGGLLTASGLAVATFGDHTITVAGAGGGNDTEALGLTSGGGGNGGNGGGAGQATNGSGGGSNGGSGTITGGSGDGTGGEMPLSAPIPALRF